MRVKCEVSGAARRGIILTIMGLGARCEAAALIGCDLLAHDRSPKRSNCGVNAEPPLQSLLFHTLDVCSNENCEDRSIFKLVYFSRRRL